MLISLKLTWTCVSSHCRTPVTFLTAEDSPKFGNAALSFLLFYLCIFSAMSPGNFLGNLVKNEGRCMHLMFCREKRTLLMHERRECHFKGKRGTFLWSSLRFPPTSCGWDCCLFCMKGAQLIAAQ